MNRVRVKDMGLSGIMETHVPRTEYDVGDEDGNVPILMTKWTSSTYNDLNILVKYHNQCNSSLL